MNANTIFTFWEPREKMTAYLRLCMGTWEPNRAAYSVIVLDHSNLVEYIGADTYDLAALKQFPLQVQKDAILAAVLEKHGGIFMDVDTIVTKDISPLAKHLARSEVVTFGRHLGFVAARAHARLLTAWRTRVQEKFAALKKETSGNPPAEWDYLGNAVVEEALRRMAADSALGRRYDRLVHAFAAQPRLIAGAWRRGLDPILFRAVHGKFLRRLDRDRHGFIAEAAHYGRVAMAPRAQYLKFWFEENLDVSAAFRDGQRVIGLHHSWTPDWYKALSEKQVWEHGCLLSKTLRHVLERRG